MSLTDFVNEREVKQETAKAAEKEAKKLNEARKSRAPKASSKGFGGK